MLLQTCGMLMLMCAVSESAKILYVMPFTARSHYNAQKELALELARRGHEVHVITAFEEKEYPPSYHQIKVDCISIWKELFDEPPNVFSTMDYSFGTFQDLLYRSGYFINDLVFNSTAVHNFMKQDHKFDVVINEVFFQESLYMFAHKYQAPLVLVTTFGNSFKANYYSRNPLQLSTVYHEYGVASEPLSFVGRLLNLYYCMYDLLWLKFSYLPRQQEYAMEKFKDLKQPVPSLEELAANAALVLMNSHFSIDTPAAYLPNFIEVGGLNLKKSNKTLPEDLQKVLDDSPQGVIYLSFGSNVRSSDLSKEKLNAFLKVFGELKQIVLMKWEDLTVPDVPKNVILRPWFPQQEVLEHKNIKLFIAHGGLLGLLEAISVGVPVLGVPVFCDQYNNILQAKQNGFAELLNYNDINEENLKKLVIKMITDTIYMAKAKEVSARFHDRPMNGIDTAIWWIEYVVRNNGAVFTKNPSLNLSFFEYHMIDVYLFVIVACLLPVLLLYKFVKYLKVLAIGKSKKKQKKH